MNTNIKSKPLKAHKPYEARCTTCGHTRFTSEKSWFRPQGWSFITGFCPSCTDHRWIVVEKIAQAAIEPDPCEATATAA